MQTRFSANPSYLARFRHLIRYSVARNRRRTSRPRQASPRFEPLEGRLLLAADIYEGFDYPALAPVAGQNAGYGWNSGWNTFGSNRWQVSSSGMTFGDLAVSGQSAIDPAAVAAGNDGNSRLYDPTLFGNLVGAGEYWFSFLFSTQGTLQVNPFNTAGINNIGQVELRGDGSLLARGDGLFQVTAPGRFVPGETAFLVGKVTTTGSSYDGANDWLEIWINPTPGLAAPDTARVINGPFGFQQPSNAGVIYQAKNPSLNFGLDEFRLGATFEDVAPVPAEGTTLIALDESGNLVVTDADGGDTDDSITIQSDTANQVFVIQQPGALIETDIPSASGNLSDTVIVPFAAVSGSAIIVDSLAGNDTLTIDYSLGNFTPSIRYFGGSGGDDGVRLVEGTFSSATYNFTDEHDGSIDISGNGLLTFTGLEPITSTIETTNVTLNYGTSSEIITVADAGSGRTTVDSTAGEIVTFNNPVGSLTIRGGDGNDFIHINSLGVLDANLHIEGQDGSDEVHVHAAMELTGISRNLGVSSELAYLLGSSVLTSGNQVYQANVYLDSPTNATTLTAGGRVEFGNTSSNFLRSAIDGEDALMVTAGDVIRVNSRIGTNQRLASFTTGGDGETQFAGVEVNTTGNQSYNHEVTAFLNGYNFRADTGHIVFADNASGTSDLNATTNGSVRFLGDLVTTTASIHVSAGQEVVVQSELKTTAGAITLDAGRNVEISAGGSIETTSGSITLRGNVSGTTAGTFVGVILNGAAIATSSGTVVLDGHGGTTGGNGVTLGGTTSFVSTTGSITIVGAASASASDGILLGGSASLTSDSGNILLEGRGGNRGINLQGRIESTGLNKATAATVTLDATGGLGIGLHMPAGDIFSVAGDITLTGRTAGDLAANLASGIELESGAIVRSTGTGSDAARIVLDGAAGAGNANNMGVLVESSGTQVVAADGSITLRGTGGGAGVSNDGVRVHAFSQVRTSGSGSILLDGIGSIAGSGRGIAILTSALVAADGTGDVTFVGTGGAAGLNNFGVTVQGSTQVVTADGDIVMAGQGGTGGGSGHRGLSFAPLAQLIAAGTGSIRLTGTGGSSGSGVFNQGTIQTTGTGTIDITGAGTGSQEGLSVTGIDAGSNAAILTSLSGVISQAAAATNVSGGVVTIHGELAPSGNTATGQMVIDGDVELTPGDSYTVALNGPAAASQYDQLRIDGAGRVIDLGEATLSVGLGFIPSAGDEFVIVDNVDSSSTVAGAFAGLPDGSSFTVSGTVLHIYYEAGLDGNDVVLIANRPPDAPVDRDGGANKVPEGSAIGTLVGLSVVATDPDGDPVTYSLLDDAGGRFAINPLSGEVSVANSALLEGNASHTITVLASDPFGASSTSDFQITVFKLVDVYGRVFEDFDNDGAYEPADGDAGIAGVVLEVWDAAMTTMFATAMSGADGTYHVDANLQPGNYKIIQVVEELADLGLLDGRETAGSLGGSVENGQDSNQIDFSVPDDGAAFDAVDYLFAEIVPSDLFGSVWRDFNNDGEINFGEFGIQGALVELVGADDRGNPVLASDLTSADGSFAFVNLRPGTYAIEETQPAGFGDGQESLGEVTDQGAPSAVADSGHVDGNDRFASINLVPGTYADRYNFGERPQPGAAIGSRVTAGIGFWHNRKGEALIESLNGGPHSTQLGHWLAATFPAMYGAGAYYDAPQGADQDMNLAGKSNAQIADIFQYLHSRNSKSAVVGGPVKIDAQVLATALAIYVTSENLAGGNYAARYGFHTSADGIAYSTFNALDVLTSQEAIELGLSPVMDGSGNATMIDILRATNDKAADGLLYDVDDDDSINHLELRLRRLANTLFSAINEEGEI